MPKSEYSSTELPKGTKSGKVNGIDGTVEDSSASSSMNSSEEWDGHGNNRITATTTTTTTPVTPTIHPTPLSFQGILRNGLSVCLRFLHNLLLK